MLSDQVEVRAVEFSFSAGKVLPAAHVVVLTKVLKDGAEIARTKHRYVVDVATGDCTHMTAPEVSQAARERITAQCATAVAEYGVWSAEA